MLTFFQTSQRDAVDAERFVGLLLPLLTHDKFDKDQLLHVSYAVERETQLLLPDGVEPIILDRVRSEGDSPRRGHCCRCSVCRGRVFRTGRGRGLREEGRVRPVGYMQ